MELISQKPQCMLRKLMEIFSQSFPPSLSLSRSRSLPVHFVPLLVFRTLKHCNLNFCNFIDIQLDRRILSLCVYWSVLYIYNKQPEIMAAANGIYYFHC